MRKLTGNEHHILKQIQKGKDFFCDPHGVNWHNNDKGIMDRKITALSFLRHAKYIKNESSLNATANLTEAGQKELTAT